MKIKKIICTVLFLAILLVCVFGLGKLFSYKNFFNQTWPTTSCYTRFYQMEKDSVDVLIFGSSVAICALIPQELYNKHGITGYNLGCEQQNMIVAYYWLLESLKYQSPKFVVIDPTYIVRATSNPLGTGEGLIRKPIDPMKFSQNKLNAVKDICRLDTTQNVISYIVPILRFHERWKSLNEEDFSYDEMVCHEDLMGATLINWSAKKKYVPFVAGEKNDVAPYNETQKEYLDKMIDVCKSNGITVLLCHPPISDSIANHNAIAAYANERGVAFFDFNESELYNEIGFDAEKELSGSHATRVGAAKITNCLGKILKEKYEVTMHLNKRVYENANIYYRQVNENFDLPKITDINKYLPLLHRNRYSVFISVRDEASAGLSDEARKKLSELGLRLDLKDHYRESYFAVMSGGKLLHEQMGKERLSRTGSIRGGRSIYTVVSAGLPYGNISQITIDGRNHSKNRRGLNIVVYDDEQRKVVDSVCFDTCDKAMKAYR